MCGAFWTNSRPVPADNAQGVTNRDRNKRRVYSLLSIHLPNVGGPGAISVPRRPFVRGWFGRFGGRDAERKHIAGTPTTAGDRESVGSGKLVLVREDRGG